MENILFKVVNGQTGDTEQDGFNTEVEAEKYLENLEDAFEDLKGCNYVTSYEYEEEKEPIRDHRPIHEQVDGWEDMFNY